MIEINPQKIDYTKRKSIEEKNPRKLVKNVSRSGELIFRGGLALQSELGTQNVERFSRFLQTPQGKTFTLQQTILQAQNPKSGTRIYNPAAPIIAKQLGQEFTKQKPKRHLDIGDGSLRGIFRGIIGRSQPRTQKENAVRFFDNKLNKQIDLQVRYGGEKNDLDIFPDRDNPAGVNKPQDFIKFRIRDAVNGKWLIFPAHLGTITDTVTPSWTPERYIGRPDAVHLYSGTDRTVSFDFKVAAFSKQEIPIIQEKMNYLMGLGYPTFKKILSSDDEERPVAPYVYLTIGDLFNNTPGFFTSITITMEENVTWEIDEGFQIPMVFNVGVEFTYVGKYLPHTLGKHYEVPWLKDSGVGNGKFGTFETDPRDPETIRPRIYGKQEWSNGVLPHEKV